MNNERSENREGTLRRPVQWRRFSLRTLFVLITVCSLFFGAWSIYVEPYRRQAQSLAVVNRLQGVVSFRPEKGPAWYHWLVTSMLGDEAFVRVDKVDLAARNIDDQTFRSLTGFKYLRDLNLDNTNISGEALSALRSMPDLTSLSLRYTKISDDSIVALSTLPKLSRLMLTGTKVSDKSIAVLEKMSSLSELYVRWTQISDAGAKKLADAMPKCATIHQALVADVASAVP
jgi:hypothetical protein